MLYKVNEIFKGMQGEGAWSGAQMSFIRLAGCNLKCYWCDTKHDCKQEMDEREIADLINSHNVDRVCITGGEPTLQDVEPLCMLLSALGHNIHLETNGTNPPPAHVDWITVSPKDHIVDAEMFARANEVKVVVATDGWEDHIKFWDPMVRSGEMYGWLMPLDWDDGTDYAMIAYNRLCNMRYTKWRLCLQIHKILKVK